MVQIGITIPISCLSQSQHPITQITYQSSPIQTSTTPGTSATRSLFIRIPFLFTPPDKDSRASFTKPFHPLVQCLRNPHQQPAKEEQAYEGNAHDDSKYNPVILDCVDTLDVTDLDREVARHETDGKE
jgi:hypothetical protein